MEKRRHCYFSGSVQGVGFRYTARRIARHYRVNGWVANLPDGRVEMEAQGEPGDLNDFMDELKKSFDGYISGVETEEIPAAGQTEDFTIKLSF